MKIETNFVRLNNDKYGNPVYHVGQYDLAALVGVTVDRLTDNADALKAAGFRKYRGSKYGTGYTVQIYNLDHNVARLRELLAAMAAN